MSVLLRYACLLGLGMVSLFMFVNAGAVTGQMLASTSGYGLQDPDDLPLYILAAVGVLGLMSVVRFVFSGFPQLMRDWYDRNLGNLAMLAMICVLGVVFIIT